MKVTLTKSGLDSAADKGLITKEQSNALWDYLSEKESTKAAFSGINAAYYFGGVIVILAMIWFATEVYEEYKAGGLLITGVVYFCGLVIAGIKLYNSQENRIPGGWLITCAVFTVPLIVFAVQDYLGVWGFEAPGNYSSAVFWFQKGWFVMELTAAAAAVIFIIKYRITFLTIPLAIVLWFMILDVSSIAAGGPSMIWEQPKFVLVLTGLIILFSAYITDRRFKEDYAFWLYLTGVVFFWSGLSLINTDSELNMFIYFCINIVLILISVLFDRRVFLIFGALGFYIYLFHLSDIVFKDSILFPAALLVLGMSIIWLGIKYSRNKEKIDGYIMARIPQGLKKVLPGD